MNSKNILAKIFIGLKEQDFATHKCLSNFYASYTKNSINKNTLDYYIDFITKNIEFNSNEERDAKHNILYTEILEKILGEEKEIECGFATQRPNENAITNMNKEDSDIDDDEQKMSKVKSTSMIFKKKRVLLVLNAYIENSFITENLNPDEDFEENNEQVKDEITNNVIEDLKADSYEKRNIVIVDNVELHDRSRRMEIRSDTENKIQQLNSDKNMFHLLSKIYIVNTTDMKILTDSITTIPIKSDFSDDNQIIVPSETLTSSYSRIQYNTRIQLKKSSPLQAITEIARNIKAIYICSGSNMTQGGNADQGINTQETDLYLRTTYSVALDKASRIYPLSRNTILLCPIVLVLKNEEFKELPNKTLRKISVLCAPSVRTWKPTLVSPSDRNTDVQDIYLNDVTYKDKNVEIKVLKELLGGLETCLFFGYDTIVIDDQAVEEHCLPVHTTAKLLQKAINSVKGRFKEIIIAISNNNVYNVFAQYFSN